MASSLSYPKLLDRTLDVTKDIIRFCERNKSLKEDLLWVLCLLASLQTSGQAVRMLLKRGFVWDAILIMRRMQEAFFTINYVLSNSSYSKHMRQAWVKEDLEDRYEYIRLAAAFDGKSLNQFVEHHPDMQQVIANYKKASREWSEEEAGYRNLIKRLRREKRTQSLPAMASRFPKRRWRSVDWFEKAEHLDLTELGREITKQTMREGNAVAHSRPGYIIRFAKSHGSGIHAFSIGRTMRSGYPPLNPWAMAMMPLLYSSIKIVEEYGLDSQAASISKPRFLPRLQAIIDEVKKHGARRERRRIRTRK